MKNRPLTQEWDSSISTSYRYSIFRSGWCDWHTKYNGNSEKKDNTIFLCSINHSWKEFKVKEYLLFEWEEQTKNDILIPEFLSWCFSSSQDNVYGFVFHETLAYHVLSPYHICYTLMCWSLIVQDSCFLYLDLVPRRSHLVQISISTPNLSLNFPGTSNCSRELCLDVNKHILLRISIIQLLISQPKSPPRIFPVTAYDNSTQAKNS